ncbi:MAG: hypothetical protein ACXWIF_19325 [Pyrinomonadaceae bacterium]
MPAQNKFLELAGALPPKPQHQPKTPKLGKKEQAQVAAETAHEDTDWESLLQ